MTNKELLALGKDLRMARMLVLRKHGFTCEEIANVLGTKESVVRRVIESADNSNNTVNEEESC
jgi:transcriptional regulator